MDYVAQLRTQVSVATVNYVSAVEATKLASVSMRKPISAEALKEFQKLRRKEERALGLYNRAKVKLLTELGIS